MKKYHTPRDVFHQGTEAILQDIADGRIQEPRPNDLCFCGSEKKYKNCHRKLQREKKSHPKKIVSMIRNKQNVVYRTCFWPGCSSPPISKSHTVQKSKELNDIAENGLVLGFDFSREFLSNKNSSSETPKPSEIGIGEASTFPGFCSHHENKFHKFENRPIDGSKEQCVLIGFRALCHELFKKEIGIRIHEECRDETCKGIDWAWQYRNVIILNNLNEGAKLAVPDLEHSLGLYNKMISAKCYDDIESYVIFFKGSSILYSAGACLLENDFDNNIVQDVFNLCDSGMLLKCITFSLLKTENTNVAIFTWPKSYSDIAFPFISSLHSKKNRTDLIIKWIFNHFENVFFSISWWNNLTEDQKMEILNAFSNAIDQRSIDYQLVDEFQNLVDWQIEKTMHNQTTILPGLDDRRLKSQ